MSEHSALSPSRSSEPSHDNPEEQPPLPFLSALSPPHIFTHDSSARSSLSNSSVDFNPYDNLDEVPLLPLSAPRTVLPPLTRDIGAELIAPTDVQHSTRNEQRENFNQPQDYRWTGSDPQRRHPYGSTAEAQYFDIAPPSPATFPKPRKQHPFAKNFEVPQWRRLTIHTALCALAYPFLLIFVIMGRGKSLFWSRVFVGAGCGILGVTLGLSLLRLARGILEAATWATVIHQSQIIDAHEPGIWLKDLAAHSDDPKSLWAALRLLWNRFWHPGADRQARKFYDSRRWSLWIIFFLLNVVLSGTLTFLFARAVEIDVHVVHQRRQYREVVVSGDLSEEDLTRAKNIQPAFDNYRVTWTLAPFSSHGELPPVVELKWKDEFVYFAEVILSQLLPGGSGFGTFDPNATSPSLDIYSHLMDAVPEVRVDSGSVLRFPRWGIRINCSKIPDIPVNLVPHSENNLTYLFTPQATIRPLFDGFNLHFPQILEQPLNFSDPNVVNAGDTLPIGLNKAGISLGAKFWDNGVAHSLKSTPLSMRSDGKGRAGEDGKGFVTVENILVRLNTTYAPNGTFGIKSNSSIPDENGTATFIGYDAAVCLELYEPWILEVYNSSVGFPSSMRIVNNTAVIEDMNTDQVKEKRVGQLVSDPLVKRGLNSTNMWPAYDAAHQNSVNQIVKDNGRDSYYVPSPTLISFTSGEGYLGYTELSEVYYAKARVLADAGNVLPYFAGSGLTVARRYDDQIATSAVISNVVMAPTIFGVLLMGLACALFVPRLPLDVPRRGFDLYSWLSAFYGYELVTQRPEGFTTKKMELKDIIDHTAELKFRYVDN